jgi:hypothetical protein
MAGINFTVGLDGSNFFGGLKNMEAAGKQTAKAIQDAFGQKLKSVLSITAIEEGVRRTGEWAAEIDRASKSLGVTREQLQTIQLIASKTGTSQDAIVGMFDNINKARDEALKGNHELIQSFQRVGITYDDLIRKTKPALFSEVLSKVNPNDKNEMMRTSIHNITGTPEGVIAGFKGGMGGQSFEKIQEAGLKSGAVINEEEVQGIAAQWAAVLTSIKDAGAQLIPVAGILLDLTKLLADGLGGLFEWVSTGLDIVFNMIKGDWNKVGEGFEHIGLLLFDFTLGVVKSVTMLIDLITNWLSKIPVIGKKFAKTDLTKKITEAQEILGEVSGRPETVRRAGAVGELFGTAYTAGSFGRASKAVGTTIGRGVGGISAKEAAAQSLEKMGLKEVTAQEGSYISQTPTDLGRVFPLPGVTKIEGKYYKMDSDLRMKRRAIRTQEMIGKSLGDAEMIGKARVNKGSFRIEIQKAVADSSKIIEAGAAKGGAIGAGIGSIFGMTDLMATAGRLTAMAEEERKKTLASSTVAGEARPIFPMWGAAGMGGAPVTGGGMLKLGGMFGSGDNKIVKLNIEMVKLLNMIQVNTSPYARAGGGYVVPKTNNMGGASGGL